MKEHAILLIKKGVVIFPVHTIISKGECSCGKKNCSSIGKHPMVPHGVKEATKDPVLVNQWWTKNPNANIGIATGGINQIEILDVDVKSGGLESLRQLLSTHGPLPTQIVVKTGGGGFHFYFRYSDNKLKNATGFQPGLDWKTDGGYVVAPPSLHKSGERYQWIDFDYQNFIQGGQYAEL